jgi:hypothetical protein
MVIAFRCLEKQVIGVHTAPNFALVTNTEPVRNPSIVDFPRYPVGTNVLAINVHMAAIVLRLSYP